MFLSSVGRLLCAAAALALACAPHDSSAKLLKGVSFEKPFDDIDADGARRISGDFDTGGAAAVNRHFVRLTPDRQSKRGHIWGKQKLAAREFSAVLTFRISGQAKSWFGDGLALWITDSQKYVQGDNHGFIGDFNGFGFVFDTFVNQEHGGGHKDVTFFENDGSKTLDQLNEMEKVGCMAPGIRYHEKNANFNPSTSLSRAKIQYKDQMITIAIDAAGTGNWVPCYSQQIRISDAFLNNAVFGITASTGGLADNHDVIGLSVYDEVDDSEVTTKDEKHKNDTSQELADELSKGDADAKMRLLKRKFQQMLEDFEYQFTALKESTENSIRKLKEQEVEDEKRIQELENWANGKMTERVSSTVDAIRDQVDERLQQTVEETAAKSGGWKTPFLLLVIVLGAIVAAGYKKYQDLRKSHLL